MNSEELKKEFGLLMPSEINGFKRPDESISSSNGFFLEIPQLISKDPVLYSTMNLIFSVILSNDKLLKQWIDTLQNVVNAQDWRVVTDSLKGYMTPELKKKLDGIANGANNYVHPSSHPASMIAQDATHRFVSDTEKNTWNGKASTAVVSTTANGLAPKRDGNASHFLAGDGTWKAVPSASSAASATKATQDSRGQQIDTTYVKGVTANNATLTITKGNGSTSTTTVNNVSRAEYSDRVGTNAGYTGSTTGSSLKGGLSQSAIYDNSFPFSYGNLISVKNAGANQIALEWSGTNGAIGGVAVRNARDACLDTWSEWRYLAYTESPAFSGTPTAPTQGTSDNSTKLATTAFVRNLINQLKNDGTLGGIVGGSLTQNGWVKFSNGLILQWGFRSDTGYGGRTVTFPIAFTKQCFNGHVTTKRGGDSSNGNNYVDKLTTTNMWTVCDGGGGYWFAIGV